MTYIGRQYRTLRNDVLGIPLQKKLGPKITYFRRFRNSVATMRANGQHVRNRKTALETTRGPIVPKFHEVWSTDG